MDDKKAYEAFRLRQFAQPHPALQAAQSAADTQALEGVEPDRDRIILHFDCDCWYAQVEERRNPSLRDKPLAVTQKYLCVTASYPARAAGVTKLMSIVDAKKACPNLVLVPGEDLTPYRAASRDMRAVISRWGPTEKLGLDETWVDVTQEVDRRLASLQGPHNLSSTPWCGHVVSAGLQLTAHSKHRPMDLRVVQEQGGQQPAHQEAGHQLLPGHQQPAAGQGPASDTKTSHQQQAQQVTCAGGGVPAAANAGSAGTGAASTDAGSSKGPAWLPLCEARLKLGALIAAEMRQAVKQETGFRCSAGIACSKLLSKLVSGLHKPDDQTTILPTQAQAFVGQLPVRALPGVGYKVEGVLKAWGVATAAEARSISRQRLIEALGDKHGAGLFHACRGVDPSPVVASGPPKSITVEDSFKACSSWQAVAQVLQVLVPDLLSRLEEDVEEYPQLQRIPLTLTVKWRKAGTGWARSSASTPWPAAARPTHGNMGRHHQGQLSEAVGSPQHPAAAAAAGCGNAEQVAVLTAAATKLLKQHLPASGFSLTLLNIGATGFKAQPCPGVNGGIQQFLAPKPHPQGSSAAAGGVGATAAASPALEEAALPGTDLLQQAKAATEARRDYSKASKGSNSRPSWSPAPASMLSSIGGGSSQQATGAAVGPVMLSKRQERRLWELAMQQQSLEQQAPAHHQQQQQQLQGSRGQQASNSQQQGAREQPLQQQDGLQPAKGLWQAAVHPGNLLNAAAPQPQPHQQQPQQPSAPLYCCASKQQGCDPPKHQRDSTNGQQQLGHQPQPCSANHLPEPLHSIPHPSTGGPSPDGSMVTAEGTAAAAAAAVCGKRHAAPDADSAGEPLVAHIAKKLASQPEAAAPTSPGVTCGVEPPSGTCQGSPSSDAAVMLHGLPHSCATNLHDVDGWGLMMCEVLEEFEEEPC